jgi:hypothetical protein
LRLVGDVGALRTAGAEIEKSGIAVLGQRRIARRA